MGGPIDLINANAMNLITPYGPSPHPSLSPSGEREGEGRAGGAERNRTPVSWIAFMHEAIHAQPSFATAPKIY
jgi:hypothetical protein